MSIFVQIASYRDPQLLPTLLSLIDNAEHPEELNIAVCWQYGPGEYLQSLVASGFEYENFCTLSEDGYTVFHLVRHGAKIALIRVPHMEAKGTCWARNLIQQLYDGETYALQLDSHHRFAPEWDATCIDMLEGLREKSAKPVLTAYLPNFVPDIDPQGRCQYSYEIVFDKFSPSGVVLGRSSAIDAGITEPIPAKFCSGHFNFADGSFAIDVQHDPEFFFTGEEISIAVRAYTHGYDMYHPVKSVVWHQYRGAGSVRLWDDNPNWWQFEATCVARNLSLFGMDNEPPQDFGKYGLGSDRTLAQYEEYAGICFATRSTWQDRLKIQGENLDHPPASEKTQTEPLSSGIFSSKISQNGKEK